MPPWVTVLLVACAVALMVWQVVTRARLRRRGRPVGRPSPVAIVLLAVVLLALAGLALTHH